MNMRGKAFPLVFGSRTGDSLISSWNVLLLAFYYRESSRWYRLCLPQWLPPETLQKVLSPVPYYFSSLNVTIMRPTIAPTAETIIPATSNVDCEISPLITVPSTTLAKTSFVASRINLQKLHQKSLILFPACLLVTFPICVSNYILFHKRYLGNKPLFQSINPKKDWSFLILYIWRGSAVLL